MIKIKKLKCGLKLVMEEIPYIQSASIGIWTNTGAVNEDINIAGISHLIEHMLFKGTENRSAKEIASHVDRIGGQINAFTGKEFTCYYIKTLSSNLNQGAEILLDMFINSVFDKKELTKEKRVIGEEIKMIEDSSDELAHDILCEEVFKGSPLSHSILGTQGSLRRISRDTIKEYMDKEYTLDSIVISVAGNFDEDEICNMFENKLHHLKATKEERTYTIEDYLPSHKVKVKDIEQSHICLGLPSLGFRDQDYYVVTVLGNMLGGTMSSRLFQRIREESGLAYSVYSVLAPFKDRGLFSIYAGVSHDKVEAAVQGIGKELKLITTESFTQEELSATKEQIKSGYIFSHENVKSRMFSNGRNLLTLGRVPDPEEVLNLLDQVTLDRVNFEAEKIGKFQDYSSVLISNKKVNLKNILKG